MVELHCEPAGLPQETWRPKVYFAGHPRAARKFFPLLQEAICRIRPCDIFYLKDPEAAIPPEEEDRVLGDYHLFVVPVITDMLANPCRTTEVEIPYARKHHIPILPILMEPGLVPLFRLPRHFEDLSFIEYETTPDHIFSFQEQLATFLNGVLISEAEAAAVQARRYHDYRDRLYYRAVSYLAGITTEANPEAALERLIKLSPHHPKALYLLYRIYYRGIGVPADPRKALACINRLSVYWHGQEEIKNWPEALQYLRDMVDNDILTVAPEGAYLLAERLYKRASRTLGELHPITLHYSKLLAHCCIRQTKYDRLLELLRRLLHFSTLQLGRDHPDTQAIVLQLAHFYHKAQEPADALELYREALDYNRQHYGPQALPTLQTLRSVAVLCNHMGRYQQALSLAEQAMEGLTNLLGSMHPETLETQRFLAAIYSNLEIRDRALLYRKNAAFALRRLYGPAHPETIRALQSLALSYRSMKQYPDAVRISLKVVGLYKKYYGPDYFQTRLAESVANKIRQEAEEAT